MSLELPRAKTPQATRYFWKFPGSADQAMLGGRAFGWPRRSRTANTSSARWPPG